MSNPKDIRDWYIMVHISAFAIAMMEYVFQHPSDESFATVGVAIPAILTLYHWFVIKDDKAPDAS